MINVYSNSSQSALKYLKNTEINIPNAIIITGDFNIRDNIWDPNYLFYLYNSDLLFDIANSFSLSISNPIENVPTRFSDNNNNTNSVLDLVFLCLSFPEFNHHVIHLDWRLFLDHALITVDILIWEKKTSHMKWLIVKGSNEEKLFVENVVKVIKNLNTSYIQNLDTLKEVIQLLSSKIEES